MTGPSLRPAGRAAIAGVAGLAAVALLLGSATGPDFGWYATWARAITAGGFSGIDTGTVAPTGLPFLQWSHGPGVYFAAVHALTPSGMTLEQAAFVAGWLSALVFWLLMAALMYRSARRDVPTAAFGLGLLAIGTHAGFYSRAHASESLALAPLAVLAWQALRERDTELRDLVAIGAAVGSLLLLRNYYAIWALPALVRCADLPARRDRAGLSRALVCLGAPVLLALPQVLLVGRWMTGRWLGSPYSFGDEGFASFAWGAPKLLTVLVHPWHGAFAYHPAYAIGIGLLVVGVAISRRPDERALIGAALVAAAANIYVQASWYAWWLGTGTFGMRGLMPLAIPTAIVLTAALAHERVPRGWRIALLAGAGSAALWSFALLRLGNTQFLTWRPLIEAVAGSLAAAASRPLLGWTIAGAVVALVVFALAGERSSLARPVALGAAFLAGLTVAWLAQLVVPVTWSRVGGLPLGAGLALAAIGGARLAWVAARERGGHGVPGRLDSVAAVACWGVGLTLLVVSTMFFRFAWGVEARTHGGPSGDGVATATFPEREVLTTYQEYLWVEGFESDKQALAGFLRRHGLLDE